LNNTRNFLSKQIVLVTGVGRRICNQQLCVHKHALRPQAF